MPHSPDDTLLGEGSMDRPALLAALRARIARLDAAGPADSVPLCEAISQRLPGGGLARATLHDVLAGDLGAAAGFCALVLARAAAGGCGSLLWITGDLDAWPPGLARFGLSPADLILVKAPKPLDGLWAMEESLRCPGIAGAVLALRDPEPTAVRQLQLAAGTGGAIGLLLRPDTTDAGASAAVTRWRVGALAGAGGAHDLVDPRWRLDLLRCRGGRPGNWRVTWRPAAERLDSDDAERLEEAEPAETPARIPRHRAG